MKNHLLKLSMVLVAAVVVAGVIAGLASSAATPSVHASRVAGIGGNGETGLQIQNLDQVESADIRAQFFDAGGNMREEVSLPPTAAGAAANIWLPSTNLPSGQYSALMASNRPIAGIIRTDWQDTAGAAIYSNVRAGTDLALPLVVRQYNGQSSIISIQNAEESVQAVVDLQIYEVGSQTPAARTEHTIPPLASVTIDLEDLDYLELGPRFVGSARITSEHMIGAQSFVDIRTSDKAVYGFEAVPTDDAASVLYVPLFRAMQYVRAGDPTSGRLDTGISVVNPGLGPADVKIRYFGSNDRAASLGCRGQPFESPTVNIPARSSHVFYQGDPASQGLPSDCFGSAIIEATSPVLAIVNDAQNEGLTSAAYNAVAGGATSVALPLYRRQHAGGLSTGIQAMNVGDTLANVEIRFTVQLESGGSAPVACQGPCNVTIEPNSSYTWWPPNLEELQANTYGSAVIESDQPIAVIVNDALVTGERDMATYNGIGIE